MAPVDTSDEEEDPSAFTSSVYCVDTGNAVEIARMEFVFPVTV